MKTDKKNSDRKVNLILIRRIGTVNFNQKFSSQKIEKFFTNYFNMI